MKYVNITTENFKIRRRKILAVYNYLGMTIYAHMDIIHKNTVVLTEAVTGWKVHWINFIEDTDYVFKHFKKVSRNKGLTRKIVKAKKKEYVELLNNNGVKTPVNDNYKSKA